jgi:hypothetical protein
MPILVVLHYLPAFLCGIHCVRTGRTQQWLWILIVGGSLGAAVYFFSVMLPDMMGGRTARRLGQAAAKALDPQREYREALEALSDVGSVGNHMRLAKAAGELGKWAEAEAHWRVCVSGHYVDDPVMLAGHARALIEVGQFGEALTRLEALRALGKEGETGAVALLFGRALEGLGRTREADAPYRYAADHTAGLEAAARYCAMLAGDGQLANARLALSEIERRFGKMHSTMRSDEKPWRAFAQESLAKAEAPAAPGPAPTPTG